MKKKIEIDYKLYKELQERRCVLRDLLDERKDLLTRERELRKEYVELEKKFYEGG